MKTISVRLEDSDYEALSNMLSNMGQTEQTFYETYTKATLYERRIPFIISGPVDPFSSDSHMERLRHSCRQAEDGNIIVKTVEELEDIAR